MCVRTKTSWGCGHEFKTTNECRSSRCQGLERYHYEKGRDCRDCKEGGHAITRGREGKGRYAQELSRRNSAESSNESLDVGSGISPWANPNKREKEWHSPSRKKADDAWLQEHVDRYSDLQTIRDSISGSDRASTTVYSPIGRTEKVYEYEEDQQHDRINPYEYRRRPSTTSRSMKIELRSMHDDYDRDSRRPAHHRGRQNSQESFGSPHSSTEYQHRRYKPAPASHTTYDYYEPYDSGYGSYSSRTSPGQSHGHALSSAKTEPYSYSPEPRMVSMKPHSPPSMSSYGAYHTGFGVRGVNVVTRAPTYAYNIPRH
ncbi:hypothetical protein PV11_05977 [Exophiala sideris]|uniref:Uncharacterized protein n=1 Tax=Exophiala sideris TaxID=1016849 RepID=A0A0D1YMC3_9EURO|nr:hypothetical protein PV11_05977 [Exophiala sideris]